MNSSENNSHDASGPVFPVSEIATEQFEPTAKLPTLLRLNVSPEASRALPSEFVKRHRILPFEIQNGTLHIVTSEPGNQRVIDDIRLLSGLEVKESHAPAAEILEKIAECYQVTVEQMVENLPEKGSTAEGKNLH